MNKNITLLSIIVLLFFNCKKENIEINQNSTIAENTIIQQKEKDYSELNLPVSYQTMEIILGNEFVPIIASIENIDNDVNEELVILYHQNNNPLAQLALFDIFPNEIIKILFQTELEITYSGKNSVSLQINNLFEDNDTHIIIEGKSLEENSANDKNHLYIYTFEPFEFKLTAHFSGTYSVFINYKEVEDQESKYYMLEDLVVIDNALSATNTNIQTKEVYIWDYQKSTFKNVATSQIVATSERSDLDRSIYTSTDKYYQYLKGFWYPDNYEELVSNNSSEIAKFTSKDIQFLMIDENGQKEISLSFGEYIDKYYISKIIRLGGQIPGLRFILMDYSYHNTRDRKSMDIYLINSKTLRVLGPGRFDKSYYKRLSKPFIEFIQEENNKQLSEIITNTRDFFQNQTFYQESNKEVTIDFASHQYFEIKLNDKKEKGIYRIKKENDMLIITLLFETENTILPATDYIITIDSYNLFFSLSPIKYNMNKIVKLTDNPLNFLLLTDS
ncbi:MAG: hypothetical protein MJB14_08555 [Spirochaetes bacterium]|nr:hypothetical protein [Spirochaetota bacterium]